jgi:hypothetical protein
MNIHRRFICKSQIWKQPRSPSIDEWLNTLVSLYQRTVLSNEIMKTDTSNVRTDLQGITLAENNPIQQDYMLYDYHLKTTKL